MSGKTHDVFVSYAQNDKNVAFAVCHGLESSGLRCWIAPRDVPPGGDFPAEIVKGISGARAFVVVLSGAANGSTHIAREVHHAAEAPMPLIPFRLEDVRPSDRLSYYLSATHWLDALDPPLEQHIESLAEVLAKMIGRESRPRDARQRDAPDVAVSTQATAQAGAHAAGKPAAPTKPGERGGPRSTPRSISAPAATPPAMHVEVPSWAKVSQAQVDEAQSHRIAVAYENEVGIRFVLVPSGTFTVGSPASELSRDDDETQHEVTLTKPYYLAVTEVTNALYRRFNPDHDRNASETLPAVNISWEDARAFLAWLSRESRHSYGLPTEAQWERAARAGTQTAYSFGNDASQIVDYGNIDGPGGHGRLAPVGSYRPNAFGLYDMHGNVWEWCQDRYGPYSDGHVHDPTGSDIPVSLRMIRGGSWFNTAWLARSAARFWTAETDRSGNLGLRPARTVSSD